MKITEIKTKDDIEIPIGKFTVLVGPNNVGKSQTLKDIHHKMVTGPNARSIVIKELIIEKPPTFEDLLEGLKVVEDPENINHQLVRGIGSNLTSGDQIRVQIDSLRQQFDQSDRLDFTFGNISKYRVSYLDAGSRLQVAQTAGAHNPHTQPPQNLLQGLFASDANMEATLRDAFKQTFGMDIRLDYSGMTQLTMRVAREFGEIDPDPRKAYTEFNKHGKLDDQGDGFRSFVGVVLSLLLSQGRTVLLDEPEAFLHPAQARQLGYWVAEHSANVPGQIIVATHNANFLAGILSSRQLVDIYRINRQDSHTTYTRISPEATQNLATSPLLSSQRVLEAIFHKGVVVCEADADRAVYQTVASQSHKNQDMLFIHAHNKQTIPKVVSLLREAQIPVCAIVDIDILNSGDDLENILTTLGYDGTYGNIQEQRQALSASISDNDEEKILESIKNNIGEFLSQLENKEHNLSGARGALNRIRKEATEWYDLKLKGLDALSDETRKIADVILTKAKETGLFIVPVGELEGWLDLGTTRKNRWIVLALESIHDGNIPKNLETFIGDTIKFLS